MGRKPDPARRDELLEAASAFVMEHGLAELSLRPLAKALGVSPRVILYHFGSKEQLVTEVVEATRRAMETPSGQRSADSIRTYWETRTRPEAKAYVRLFFEVLMLSLQNPERPAYRAFLKDMEREVFTPWDTFFEREGRSPEQAKRDATLVAGALRGILIDYLVSGDLERTTAAVESLAQIVGDESAPEPPEPHVAEAARIGTTS